MASHWKKRQEGPMQYRQDRTGQPKGSRDQGVKAILAIGTKGASVFSEREVSDHFSYHRSAEELWLEGTS